MLNRCILYWQGIPGAAGRQGPAGEKGDKGSAGLDEVIQTWHFIVRTGNRQKVIFVFKP